MRGRGQFTRMELLVYGTAALMAVGLIAIFIAAAFTGPRIEG
jgi:hypothetical protein